LGESTRGGTPTHRATANYEKRQQYLQPLPQNGQQHGKQLIFILSPTHSSHDCGLIKKQLYLQPLLQNGQQHGKQLIFISHPPTHRATANYKKKEAIPAAAAPEWATAQEAAHLYFVPHPLIARLRTD